MYTSKCICIYVYVCMSKYIDTHTCMDIYIYTHHTYTSPDIAITKTILFMFSYISQCQSNHGLTWPGLAKSGQAWPGLSFAGTLGPCGPPGPL